MKSINKLHFIILLICLCIGINTNAQSIVLHFANGSDIVVAKDIEKFIQSEKREFSCSDIISIYGYTDNVGSDDDNKLLAEKRINTVKEFIEKYFLKENNDDNLQR
jgi:flagellar motor protein MotB